MKRGKIWRGMGIALLTVTIDQLTKMWASHQGWVQLNSGVSLSWLAELPNGVLLVLLSLILIGIGWQGRQLWRQFPLWAVLFFAGASSNLLDRILYSGVRDWLSVPIFLLKNNLADWAVVVSLGAILLCKSKFYTKTKISP